MKRFLALSLASLFIAAAAPVGKPAPEFTGRDVLSGKELSLKELRGKPVVLEWNNFGCPFVKKHYGSGNMQKLQSEAAKDSVHWITINSSAEGKQGYFKDGAAVKAGLKENNANPAHYILDHDGTIGHAYGATVTPHMYVIDSEGRLVYAGAIDDKPTPSQEDIAGATNYVRDALASLKAGKPVKVSESKAYGCGVKYGDY